MINFFDILYLTFKNFYENKKKLFLTISGIVIGIFVFVFFLNVSSGLYQAVFNQFSFSGFNVIGVQLSSQVGDGPPVGDGLTDRDINRIKRATNNYKYIQPGIFFDSSFEKNKEVSRGLFLSYKDWDKVLQDIDTQPKEGRNIKDSDRKKLVFGAKAAQVFDVEKPIKAGDNIVISNKKYKVVGILEERGDLFIDGTIYSSFSDIKEISNQETYSLIRISYNDGVNISEEVLNLKKELNGKDTINGKYLISNPKEAIERVSSLINVLTFVISFISSIALIVGGINVMNTMYMSVIERKNQISTLKAIGATNSDITKLFLIESSFFGIIGSFIGFMIAFLIAKIISILILSFSGFDIPIIFSFSNLFLTIILTTIFTIIFGLYPAIKAAKINPADNLKED